MNKGKTIYNFQFNIASNLMNQIVTDWLNGNNFKFENKYGESFYYRFDAWNGNRGFQYNITGNMLNINAWIIGIGKTFYMLDSGALNNMAGDSFKNILNSLFIKINEVNSSVQTQQVVTFPPNNNQMVQQSIINQNQQQGGSQFCNSLIEQNEKRNIKLCNISFWLSIAGLILSFSGFTFGIIIYVINFYFAFMGLQTKKRTRAIAAIVMSILSIIIVIAQLIYAKD